MFPTFVPLYIFAGLTFQDRPHALLAIRFIPLKTTSSPLVVVVVTDCLKAGSGGGSFFQLGAAIILRGAMSLLPISRAPR